MIDNLAQILALPHVPASADIPSQLPNSPGVYFVIKNDQIAYIGSTRSLCRRWERHHLTRSQLEGSSIYYLEIAVTSETDVYSIEKSLITRFRPSLNKLILDTNMAMTSTERHKRWRSTTGKRRVELWIDTDLHDTLNAQAKEAGKTITEWIRELLTTRGTQRLLSISGKGARQGETERRAILAQQALAL